MPNITGACGELFLDNSFGAFLLELLSFLFFFGTLCGIVYLLLPSREMLLKTKDERVVAGLIWVGGLLSLVCVSIFFYLINRAEVEWTSLKISEVGDTLSGFSTFLAFTWLIITVFIQSRELKNQHREMAEMSRASTDQADTLRKTLRYQALGYMEGKQSEVREYLLEHLQIISEVIVEFHKRHDVVVGPDDFFNYPKPGMEYAVSILCGVELEYSPLTSGDPFSIKDDFTSDDYIFVVDVDAQLDYIIRAIGPIIEISEELDAQAEFSAWATLIGIHWLIEYKSRIRELRDQMSKLVAEEKGTGFSQQQRQWARAYVDIDPANPILPDENLA